MTPTKTLRQREKELQALLTTPAGRAELRELVARCHAVTGRLRPAVLVHEREQGLIRD